MVKELYYVPSKSFGKNSLDAALVYICANAFVDGMRNYAKLRDSLNMDYKFYVFSKMIWFMERKERLIDNLDRLWNLWTWL